jgi:hypothetical protein
MSRASSRSVEPLVWLRAGSPLLRHWKGNRDAAVRRAGNGRKWREFRVWPAAAERLKPRGVRVTIQQARHPESDICISQLLEKGLVAVCAGARYRTHRAKPHDRPRGDPKKAWGFGVSASNRAPASPLPSFDA